MGQFYFSKLQQQNLNFVNLREVLIKMEIVNYGVRILLLVGEMNE